jgi:hypothetical protein
VLLRLETWSATHAPALVAFLLAALVASRRGLSESELWAAVHEDAPTVAAVAAHSFRDWAHIRAVPSVVWARCLDDLKR